MMKNSSTVVGKPLETDSGGSAEPLKLRTLNQMSRSLTGVALRPRLYG